MAKNKDTSNINRTGIYDYEDETITYFDPKGDKPPAIYSVREIFNSLHKKEISVTWAVVSDGAEVMGEEE